MYSFIVAPVVRARSSRISQFENKNTMIECEVESNPTATVTWYRDATVIEPNWKFRPHVSEKFQIDVMIIKYYLFAVRVTYKTDKTE